MYWLSFRFMRKALALVPSFWLPACKYGIEHILSL